MKIEIPKLNYKMLDCMRFVCKARATESTRYAINHVKIEKNRLIATDGHRLHIAEIKHDYDEGMYEVMSCKVNGVILLKNDDAGNFPKYEDIIPEHKKYFETKDAGGKWSNASLIAFGLAQKNITLNPIFLDEASAGDSWKVYFGDSDRPVMLINDNKKAVIMPVSHDKIVFKADDA